MPKEQKTQSESKISTIKKVKTFITSAAFAWLIIWTLAVLLVGLVSGWTLRSDDNAFSNAQIQTTIQAVTQSLK